jgi:hypothetical protein
MRGRPIASTGCEATPTSTLPSHFIAPIPPNREYREASTPPSHFVAPTSTHRTYSSSSHSIAPNFHLIAPKATAPPISSHFENRIQGVPLRTFRILQWSIIHTGVGLALILKAVIALVRLFATNLSLYTHSLSIAHRICFINASIVFSHGIWVNHPDTFPSTDRSSCYRYIRLSGVDDHLWRPGRSRGTYECRCSLTSSSAHAAP